MLCPLALPDKMHAAIALFNKPVHRRHGSRSGRALGAILLLLLCLGSPGMAGGSALRAFHPAAATISTTELHDRLLTVALIDVRSRFEFDVVHIPRSINLPVDNGRFAEQIAQLTPVQAGIEVVLIGNDPDCSRPFTAAGIARALGVDKVLVYDAGVYSWLHAYPERTRLMGEIPARLEQVVPLLSHQQRLASFDRFLEISGRQQSLVVDIRNNYQRYLTPHGLPLRTITMEALLAGIGDRIWVEHRLLLFDEDGSKTRWLQLFLRAAGFHDYLFLDGGMNGVPATSLTAAENDGRASISIDQQQLRTSLTSLWEMGQASEFLTYIFSCLRWDNIAFVRLEEITDYLDISRETIRTLSESLVRSGQIRFYEADDVLIVQVDPLLAWKGEKGGIAWQRSVDQFHQRYRP